MSNALKRQFRGWAIAIILVCVCTLLLWAIAPWLRITYYTIEIESHKDDPNGNYYAVQLAALGKKIPTPPGLPFPLLYTPRMGDESCSLCPNGYIVLYVRDDSAHKAYLVVFRRNDSTYEIVAKWEADEG